ncbi:hypothetical protein [Streptomyces sp. NPDC054834]
MSTFIEPSDATIGALLRHRLETPTTSSELHLHQLGGAYARVPADTTALSQREPSVLCNVIARSPDATDFDAHVAWARHTRKDIAHHGHGTMYVNFPGDAAEHRVRFRLDQNIHPSAAA